MPQSIETMNGSMLTVYTAAELQAYGKSPRDDWRSPEWAIDMFGWSEPHYIYPLSPMQPRWEQLFTAPPAEFTKPGFLEIYTRSEGPLTGEEVRRKEKLASLNIDDHVAVNAYMNLLRQNHALYDGIIEPAEVREGLPADQRSAFDSVIPEVEAIIAGAVVFFRFDGIHLDDILIPGLLPEAPPTFKVTVERGELVAFALMGQHALRREVFAGGVGYRYPAHLTDMGKPGRDRYARYTGQHSLWGLINAPGVLLALLQASQRIEGREVTMPSSPLVPPQLFGEGVEIHPGGGTPLPDPDHPAPGTHA